MSSSFNLVDRPWIRVTYLDGVTGELSLQEVFEQADHIAVIAGELASQDVAILRLLVAICHRALGGPKTLAEWEKAWTDPEVLRNAVTAYLEEHRPRFDLRDPVAPFFQVAGIAENSGEALERLIGDYPNRTQFFTNRQGRSVKSITWAEAARWLIHVHAFDTSGPKTAEDGDPRAKNGKTYGTVGWAGQLGVVSIAGNNLKSTLLLNTVVCAKLQDLRNVRTGSDLPPWEHVPSRAFGDGTSVPTGPVACYTWQTRRVLLKGTDEHVDRIFLGTGDPLTPENRFGVEPMTAWRYSGSQSDKLGSPVYMPRPLSKKQAFWRGLPSLTSQLSAEMVNKDGNSQFKPPAVLAFYQLLVSEELAPVQGLVHVRAVGIEYERKKKSTIEELIDDSLELPTKLIRRDSPLITCVRDAMSEADLAAFAIQKLAANLARACGADPDKANATGDSARAAMYAVLDQEFPRWLASLEKADPVGARDSWRTFLHREANRQGLDLTAALPATAFVGRGTGDARMDAGKALAYFRSALRKGIPYPTQEESLVNETGRTTE